jgi:hypothetical protein
MISEYLKGFLQVYAGCLLAVAAMAFFVLMDALAQSCTRQGVPDAEVVFIRMVRAFSTAWSP